MMARKATILPLAWLLALFYLSLPHFVNAQDMTPQEQDAATFSAYSQCAQGECGRTLGRGRRLAVFLVPIMFKLGIIMTLLVGLSVMAFKSISIGLMLLYLAFSSHQKYKHSWHHRSHEEPVHVHYHDSEPPPVHSLVNSYHHQPDYSHGPWSKEIVEIVEPPRKVREEYYSSKRIFNASRPLKSRRHR